MKRTRNAVKCQRKAEIQSDAQPQLPVMEASTATWFTWVHHTQAIILRWEGLFHRFVCSLWMFRNSRASTQYRGSVSNISQLDAGPLIVYNHHDPFMMPPPAMLSRAPSMSQMWYPQPPPMPPFAPYFYGPSPFSAPMPPPMDPKSMRKAMKQARKLDKKRQLEADIAMNRVGCSYYCCDSVAQLLWCIIAITLIGFCAALVFAWYIL